MNISVTRISLWFMAVAIPFYALGQSQNGQITGSVSDTTAARIPHAKLTLTNEATGAKRLSESNDNGFYVFPQIEPGKYDILAQAPGFQPLMQKNISLEIAATVRVDLVLTVSKSRETVTVTTAPPLLDKDTANRNVTLSRNEVATLPIQSHNPITLAFTSASTSAVYGKVPSAVSGTYNLGYFSLNGGRSGEVLFLVDGVSAMDGRAGLPAVVPAPQATQEVQVISNTFDTQYGKTGGAVVTMVTRGGGNDFHGSLFEYIQNGVANANTWSNNLAGLPIGSSRFNNFGADLSGPLWRSKRLFFFGNYQGVRQQTPVAPVTGLNGNNGASLASVPTQLQRQGDFSQTYNSNGSLAAIYNPFSGVLNSDGQYVRNPFPNNTIPASMIDPVGLKVANLFPMPSFAGNSFTSANNYARSYSNVAGDNEYDTRVDWVKSDRYSLFGHFTYDHKYSTPTPFLGEGIDIGYGLTLPSYLVTIGQTFVHSPQWITTVNIGADRIAYTQVNPSLQAGISGSTIGLPSSLVNQFQINTIPRFNLTNYSALGNPTQTKNPAEVRDLRVNSSKVFGTHTVNFGGDGEIQIAAGGSPSSATFNLTRGLTSGPIAATDSSTSGNAVASLLLGTLSSATAAIVPLNYTTNKSIGSYIQDSWKVTPRLTLQYGLRYEVQFGATERYNRLNSFDTSVQNPLSAATGLNLVGGLQFADSQHREAWDTDYRNFAPRFGLAYEVSNKLTFRAGYGIYYLQAYGTGGNNGFSITTSATTTVGNAGLVPENLLQNPFPSGLLQPTGSSLGLLTNVGTSLSASYRLNPTPYVQDYTASFQYGLTNNSVLEVGYQGSQGRKLPVAFTLNMDQLPPQYLSLGTQLDQQVTNPFYGSVTTGPLSGPTIAYNQLLRPYPQYTSIGLNPNTPMASSSFNALSVKYRRRLSAGLSTSLTYQWSKAIDDSSETLTAIFGDAARNSYNISLERSISAHDVPQSFVGVVDWEVPVGRGRRFGGNMSSWLDKVIGNWQFSTIVTLQSGLPLEFSCPNTLSSYGYSVCRPDITNLEDLTLSNRTPSQWFNTSSSIITAPAPYAIGTAPRLVPNIRTGSITNADLTLRKSFPIKERINLRFQITAYNLTNTPQYGRADTTVGSPTFGQVTGIYSNSIARNLEAAVRIDF